jgi:hypothetical protein
MDLYLFDVNNFAAAATLTRRPLRAAVAIRAFEMLAGRYLARNVF